MPDFNLWIKKPRMTLFLKPHAKIELDTSNPICVCYIKAGVGATIFFNIQRQTGPIVVPSFYTRFNISAVAYGIASHYVRII